MDAQNVGLFDASVVAGLSDEKSDHWEEQFRLHFARSDTFVTEQPQNPHKSRHLGGAGDDPVPPAPTLPVHRHDICLHEKCAHRVHALPEDLARVVYAWGHLPEAVKVEILAMVNAAWQP